MGEPTPPCLIAIEEIEGGACGREENDIPCTRERASRSYSCIETLINRHEDRNPRVSGLDGQSFAEFSCQPNTGFFEKV